MRQSFWFQADVDCMWKRLGYMQLGASVETKERGNVKGRAGGGNCKMGPLVNVHSLVLAGSAVDSIIGVERGLGVSPFGLRDTGIALATIVIYFCDQYSTHAQSGQIFWIQIFWIMCLGLHFALVRWLGCFESSMGLDAPRLRGFEALGP